MQKTKEYYERLVKLVKTKDSLMKQINSINFNMSNNSEALARTTKMFAYIELDSLNQKLFNTDKELMQYTAEEIQLYQFVIEDFLDEKQLRIELLKFQQRRKSRLAFNLGKAPVNYEPLRDEKMCIMFALMLAFNFSRITENALIELVQQYKLDNEFKNELQDKIIANTFHNIFGDLKYGKK